MAGHSLANIRLSRRRAASAIGDTARLLRIRGDAMQETVPRRPGRHGSTSRPRFRSRRRRCRRSCRGRSLPGGERQWRRSGRRVGHEGRRRALHGDRERRRAHAVQLLLPVSAPFHCALMQPAADVMADALASVEIRSPCVPIVANVLAAPLTEPGAIRSSLVQQVTGTVRWRESMAWMAGQGVDAFYEVGSGKCCRASSNGSSTARKVSPSARRTMSRRSWPAAKA